MRNQKLPLTGMLWALGAMLVLQSCGGTRQEATPVERKSIAVKVIRVASTQRDQVYEAAGSVRPSRRAVLASRLQATVIAMPVNLGDAVKAGQLLVELDPSETDAEVARTRAAQAAAASGLQRAGSGVVAAEAEARLAAATLARFRQLLERRSVSQQEFDQTEARNRTAEAGLEMARAQLQDAEAQMNAALAGLEAAQIRRSYARISAPFDGFVAERSVDAGSVVSPGMPLVVIEDSRGYQLEAVLPESHLPNVRIGDEVRVSVPSISLEGAGRVAEIQAGAEPGSRSGLVRIDLPADRRLRSGLFGRAFFTTGKAGTLAVPEELVLRQGELRYVFAVSEGRVRMRLVTIGRIAEGSAEILSGLSEGDQIAASSLELLADGAPVEIVQ